jgi:hypothetical protein
VTFTRQCALISQTSLGCKSVIDGVYRLAKSLLAIATCDLNHKERERERVWEHHFYYDIAPAYVIVHKKITATKVSCNFISCRYAIPVIFLIF